MKTSENLWKPPKTSKNIEKHLESSQNMSTIFQHLKKIETPFLQKIFKHLSKSCQKTVKKKLKISVKIKNQKNSSQNQKIYKSKKTKIMGWKNRRVCGICGIYNLKKILQTEKLTHPAKACQGPPSPAKSHKILKNSTESNKPKMSKLKPRI